MKLHCIIQASIPVDELQIIHRYRPAYNDEHDRRYQGYSRHVGSILKSKEFVKYYDGKCIMRFFLMV